MTEQQETVEVPKATLKLVLEKVDALIQLVEREGSGSRADS